MRYSASRRNAGKGEGLYYTRGFKEKQAQFSPGSVPWKETFLPSHDRIARTSCFLALMGLGACSVYRVTGSRKEKKMFL